GRTARATETLTRPSGVDEVDLYPLCDGLRTARTPTPCALVIFGASGDLTSRKLIPALYALCSQGNLPGGFTVIGAARTEMTDDQFRHAMRESIPKYARGPFREAAWKW